MYIRMFCFQDVTGRVIQQKPVKPIAKKAQQKEQEQEEEDEEDEDAAEDEDEDAAEDDDEEEVKEAKVRLERQLRWFERRGAFRLLGFDDIDDFNYFQGTMNSRDGSSDVTEGDAFELEPTRIVITEAAVRKRYHRLSLRCHPDKGGDAVVFQKLKNIL